jgi:hypothetical protein
MIGRRAAGRPAAAVDAWPADLAVQTTYEWLRHLPSDDRRASHLDQNGLSTLWEHTIGRRATRATLSMARAVVAQFYGVSVRTLGRKRTPDRVNGSREHNDLRAQALRKACDPTDDEVCSEIVSPTMQRTVVDVASKTRQLRLTILECPPGYVTGRRPRPASDARG